MNLIPTILLAFILFFGISCKNANHQSVDNQVSLFIGTYTFQDSKGIYHCLFDTITGKISQPKLAAQVENPSFLTFSEKKKYLYAVSEKGSKTGFPSGKIIAYHVIKEDSIRYLNEEFTKGNHPCFVSTVENYALVANYSSGNISVLPIKEDGSLDTLSCLIQHKGHGPNQQGQESPHAHCIKPMPGTDLILSADLGINKVLIYRMDPAEGILTRKDQINLPPGAGRRHIDFHPSGRYLAVINELDCTITHYSIDPEKNRIELRQRISTLPDDFKLYNTCADIHYSKDGRFLYGSNRGHNSIVINKVDEKSGNLEFVGWVSTKGSTPRNFNIDPSGKFLLVANQDSHNIVVFRINRQTGELEETGIEINVSMPVCLLF